MSKYVKPEAEVPGNIPPTEKNEKVGPEAKEGTIVQWTIAQKTGKLYLPEEI